MYGQSSIGFFGNPVALSADGKPQAKIGGVTIDWTTVAAVSGSPVTLPSGAVVPVGAQYLGVGQTVCLITSVVNGSTVGMYGPYDPAASDGRAVIAPNSDCYLLNRDAFALDGADQYPEAIYGGRVWLARLKNSGVGAHSLAAGPTKAELVAAFPRLELVTGN